MMNQSRTNFLEQLGYEPIREQLAQMQEPNQSLLKLLVSCQKLQYKAAYSASKDASHSCWQHFKTKEN